MGVGYLSPILSPLDELIAKGSVTAQSATNLTNVLSDTYYFYSLKIYGIGSANGKFNLRFRENTTDKSASYQLANVRIDGSGGVGNWYSTTSGSDGYLTTFNTSTQSFANFEFTRPSATTGIGNVTGWAGNDAVATLCSIFNNSMTNFNGLSLFPASGTWTGYYILTGRRA